MSRKIHNLVIHLPGGQTLTGSGRNVLATMERTYNQEVKPEKHMYASLADQFRNGHSTSSEERYVGTFQGQFSFVGSLHLPALPETTETDAQVVKVSVDVT